MANTSLDPAVATRVAADHRETAGGVTTEIGRFDDAVNLMDDYCEGAMVRALMQARDAWVQEARSIVADLEEMAGNIDGTVTDFDAQDASNAGNIGTVGVDILKGI